MNIFEYFRENMYGRRHYRVPNSIYRLFCGGRSRRYAKIRDAVPLQMEISRC